VGDRTKLVLDFFGLGELPVSDQIIVIGLAVCSLLLFKTAFSVGVFRGTLNFLATRTTDITEELIMKVFASKPYAIRTASIQSTVYDVTSGISVLVLGLLGSLLIVLSDLSLLVIMFVGLFYINIAMSILTMTIFSVSAILVYLFLSKKSRFLGVTHGKLQTEAANLVQRAILSYNEQVVRNTRYTIANKIAANRKIYSAIGAKAKFYNSLSKYIFEVLMVICIFVIATYIYLFVPPETGVAIVAVFLGASSRIAPALLRVQQSLLSINSNIGMAKTTLKLIRTYRDSPRLENEIASFSFEHKGFVPNVNFKNLSFRYSDSSDIIRNFSEDIKQGEFIGISGPSGSGKSTLVDLLLGNLEPNEGQVLIGGMLPQEVFKMYPGAVGYVPQEVHIFADTLKGNLVYGFKSESVPENFIWEALRISGLEPTVKNWTLGLDTPLSERGTNLSGGQRQRIGIARAILTRPKLLILDEATSSLDRKTEDSIMSKISQFVGEVTMVLVSHRQQVLDQADRVFAIKNISPSKK
jgi:ABC-type multidrug transport system fused ATPase/permease subunit